jgi:hypothetical protein
MASTGEGQQKGPGWAKAAIWGNIPDYLKPQFGNVNNVTSADFINMWRSKVEGDNSPVTGSPAGMPVQAEAASGSPAGLPVQAGQEPQQPQPQPQPMTAQALAAHGTGTGMPLFGGQQSQPDNPFDGATQLGLAMMKPPAAAPPLSPIQFHFANIPQRRVDYSGLQALLSGRTS